MRLAISTIKEVASMPSENNVLVLGICFILIWFKQHIWKQGHSLLMQTITKFSTYLDNWLILFAITNVFTRPHIDLVNWSISSYFTYLCGWKIIPWNYIVLVWPQKQKTKAHYLWLWVLLHLFFMRTTCCESHQSSFLWYRFLTMTF